MNEKLKALLDAVNQVVTDPEYKNLAENTQDMLEDLTYNIPLEEAYHQQLLAKACTGCG